MVDVGERGEGMKGVGVDEVEKGIGRAGVEVMLDAAFDFCEAGREAALGFSESIKFGIAFHGGGLYRGSDENIIRNK